MTTTKPQSTTEPTLEPCPWCAAIPQPFKHHQIVEHKPWCFLSTFGAPVTEHIYAPKYNAWNTRISASAAPVVERDDIPEHIMMEIVGPVTSARAAAEEITDSIRQLDEGQWNADTIQAIIERHFH